MTPSNIYLALRQHFSPSQIKNLVPALRQEPLVWEYVITQFTAILENQDFCDPNNWTPLRLGQNALGLENRDEAQLDAVHQKSVEIVKNLPKPVTTLSTLDQASAIAFSLMKIGKPAKKIGLSISHAFSNENYALDSSGWKSVLACLPIELLTPEAVPFDQLIHAVLCQPIDEEALVNIIKSHFLHADIATQIKVIQFLAQSGRTNLSQLVANQFINDFHIEEMETVDSIHNIRQQALLYQAAGNLEKADELLGACEKKLALTKTEIIKQQEILKEDSSKLFFDNGEDGISADLATVNLYLEQGNIAESKKLAQSISAKMIERVANRKSVTNAPNYVLDVNPMPLISQMHDLGLDQDALQIALLFLKDRPTDEALLTSISIILEGMDDQINAVHYAEIAAGLNPESLQNRRRLAGLYGIANDWEAAFEIRSELVTSEQSENQTDWLDYAEAAYQTSRHEMVFSACQHVLDMDANCGKAFCLIGKTSLKLGDVSQAKEALNNATLLNSEDQDAWLYLADAYSQTGEEGFAVDSLRKAAMANPESIDINYALAEGLLNEGNPTEALPYLKRCIILAPRSAVTALKLGKTLFNLGSYDEAEQILGNAFQKWPLDVEIASALADTYLAIGKKDAAIKPLRVVIQGKDVDTNMLINYAECVLNADAPVYMQSTPISIDRLNDGIDTLEKVIQQDPKHLKAQMLLGESFIVKGEPATAKQIFQQLMENISEFGSGYAARIKTGFGFSCLQIGESEAAITVLQEVSQSSEDNVFVLQRLAEAYEQVKLINESMQTADYALRTAPMDINNLVWFGQMAERANKLTEAINAYESAAQLQPETPQFALETARLYIQQGEAELARKWLFSAKEQPNLTTDDYRSAAYSYLRLQDAQAGFECLQKAVETNQHATPEMVLEFAVLTRSLYGEEKALQVLQSGMKTIPETKYLLTYQADILHALHRDQAALSVLETARRCQGVLNQDETSATESNTKGFVSTTWLDGLKSDKGIDARIAGMHFSQGNLVGGLEILEQLVDTFSFDLALRTCALEAAFGLLDYEKIAYLCFPETPEPDKFETEELPALVDYLSLLAEIALQQSNDIEAGLYLNSLVTIDPSKARVKALQARMLLRKGDRKTAELAFLDAENSSQTEWKVMRSGEEWLAGLSTINSSDWLADTALELGFYEKAIEESEKACANQAGSLLNQLRIVQVITKAGYAYKTRNELYSITHNINYKMLENGIERITRAQEAANSIRRQVQVEEWAVLGNAIMEPVPANVHAMLQYEPDEHTAQFHAAVLRWIHNQSNAIEICEKYSEQPEVLLQKALCNLPTDIEQGVKSIAKAIYHASDDPLNYVVAALLAEEQKDIKGALSEMESALKIWQDEPEWLCMAAKYADLLGDADKALTYYKNAADFDNKSMKYVLAYGYALIDSGNPGQAVTLLEANPSTGEQKTEMQIALGTAYLKSGDIDKASAQVSALLESECNSADCYILISQVAYRKGKDEEAIQAAQKGVQLEPKNIAAIYYLVQLLRSLNRPVDALSNLEQHWPDVLNEAEFALVRAELVYEIDGAQAALPMIEGLNSIPNKSLKVWKLIARIENECGEQEKFTSAAMAGLKLNPTDSELNLWLGKAQSKTGQLDQAVQYFSEVIRQQPVNVEAYLDLAALFQKRREDVQAVQILRKAIDAFPHDYRPYYEAGLIFRETKDFAGAEAMLRRAAELAPSDIMIRRQLGAIIALNLVHQV